MRIKMLVMDVDGTMTDGKIYIGSGGEVMKAFNVKDGYGIINLDKIGITPVIITGRKSEIVAERARELKISEIYQGITDKLRQLELVREKYNLTEGEVAYIGDDLNDMECIEHCGLTACPSDALDQIKPQVSFICKNNGGNGAVREFISYIIEHNKKQS